MRFGKSECGGGAALANVFVERLQGKAYTPHVQVLMLRTYFDKTSLCIAGHMPAKCGVFAGITRFQSGKKINKFATCTGQLKYVAERFMGFWSDWLTLQSSVPTIP
eukprot:TRINITY_DN21194_c0_g1_i1.p1 TRINITY_DN21194_c0_g1~~TRINITY_DN21194_c0_g1_i1.p1  ORF type:complete len:106 (+),score=0.36 TRINITY_DN21194_c0_g1_i1:417-734(+)